MINIVAAYNKKRVIGKDGGIPWHVPEDLWHFQRLTKGHPIIMGRKTHESIGRLLPNRRNIIVTRQKDYRPVDVSDAVFVMPSLELAIEAAQREDDEVFIIGGAEIYRHSLPFSDRMYLTLIDDDSDGDTHFPEFIRGNWREVQKENLTPKASVILYERVK